MMMLHLFGFMDTLSDDMRERYVDELDRSESEVQPSV